MNILGISCWYHDSAACLLQDGRITAAAQEERFTRRKHDPNFPKHATRYCLRAGGIDAADLDLVAFYDKPFLKFERLLETYVSYAPRGLRSFLKAMPLWLKQKLWIPDLIRQELGYEGDIIFPEHHESHAASAFYPSPFERAAILTMDGVGEWATTSIGIGEGRSVRLLAEQHFPHSLGLLYSAFTYFCGFRVNSGEYKLMGLAPYGEPTFVDVIRESLIDVRDDGSFRLDMDYFTYASGLTMTGRRFADLFGGSRREPESDLTQREMDLARSVQEVTEDVVLKMARYARRETGESRLVAAGGVALNCVANGELVRSGIFDEVWFQPAAGDAGGALGAAYAAMYLAEGERGAGGGASDENGAGHVAGGTPGTTERPDAPSDTMPDARLDATPDTVPDRSHPPAHSDAMQGAYLGPSFTEDEIAAELETRGLPFERFPRGDLIDRVAHLLADGKTVGWFRGRMEFGPRALGNRSILADPRGRDVQRTVNLKIKYRESFRPFAPSVLEEAAGDWFDLNEPSPYMLVVADVLDAEVGGTGLDRLKQIDSRIPAVTHVDGSARIQTVSTETNPDYHALISAFGRLTGCPVLVNTSFNVRGEPIVCSPADAVDCFLATHLDVLALENCLVLKTDIPDADQDLMTAEEAAARYGLD